MRRPTIHPRDELLQIAAEYRHLKSARNGESDRGRHRRRLEAKLAEEAQRFEGLVARWVDDERDRRAWLDHLHKGSPAPSEPDPPDPLVFRGRTGTGSLLEIRKRRDGGGVDVTLDGSVLEHWEGASADPHEAYREVSGGELTEIFGASPPALGSLRDFVERGRRDPPWERARELLDDGLIDENFGLTERGRRALAAGL